ncbi:hypothetical protein IAQ61_002690 [Plenodomus lingam]|uniref:uncharacterized protein n=1 Tax=Leptosphaeria maculans TaxID=5022 RepID=UPI00331BE8C1|nr:hypothetical protein IAQ61_002690 [Plenodomus lingam]
MYGSQLPAKPPTKMEKDLDFQLWARQETRPTEQNDEIAHLVNSLVIADQYGRRLTPFHHISITNQEERSIFDTSSDESNIMGSLSDELNDYSYIFSWRSLSSNSLPTLGGLHASERHGGSDRDTLSSQQARNHIRDSLTDHRVSTISWVTGVTDEVPTTHLAIEEDLFQPDKPSALRRNAAVRCKSMKTATELPRLDSTKPSSKSFHRRVPQLPTLLPSAYPRCMYRNMSFDTDDEVITLASSLVPTVDLQCAQVDTHIQEASPHDDEEDNAKSLNVADTAHTSQQNSCIHESKIPPSTQEMKKSPRSESPHVRPRIARTFTEMGFGRVVPTALKE